jgi:FixJ family two-component response regulator
LRFVGTATNVFGMAVQGKTKMVAIVDDDDSVRSALHGMLKAVGLPALAFASAEEFLSLANSTTQHV